eukprot:gene170-919_t
MKSKNKETPTATVEENRLLRDEVRLLRGKLAYFDSRFFDSRQTQCNLLEKLFSSGACSIAPTQRAVIKNMALKAKSNDETIRQQAARIFTLEDALDPSIMNGCVSPDATDSDSIPDTVTAVVPFINDILLSEHSKPERLSRESTKASKASTNPEHVFLDLLDGADPVFCIEKFLAFFQVTDGFTAIPPTYVLLPLLVLAQRNHYGECHALSKLQQLTVSSPKMLALCGEKITNDCFPYTGCVITNQLTEEQSAFLCHIALQQGCRHFQFALSVSSNSQGAMTAARSAMTFRIMNLFKTLSFLRDSDNCVLSICTTPSSENFFHEVYRALLASNFRIDY